MRRPFESWLAEHFERFVAVKRAGGAVYDSQRGLLLAFDGYLCEHSPAPPLERDTLLRYLVSSEKTPRARDNVVSVLSQALAHARRHGAPVEWLPERPPKPSASWRRRQPRIVSCDEMQRWLRAAHDLPPANGWRGVTIAASPIFVSIRRRRLSEPAAQGGVNAASMAAQLSPPRPRPHDLRHTFAVSRLAACHPEGRDPQVLLPILSTYLGHASVEGTRQYLVANGSILEHAARRFSTYGTILDEVGS